MTKKSEVDPAFVPRSASFTRTAPLPAYTHAGANLEFHDECTDYDMGDCMVSNTETEKAERTEHNPENEFHANFGHLAAKLFGVTTLSTPKEYSEFFLAAVVLGNLQRYITTQENEYLDAISVYATRLKDLTDDGK